jgi:hypothetical protein
MLHLATLRWSTRSGYVLLTAENSIRLTGDATVVLCLPGAMVLHARYHEVFHWLCTDPHRQRKEMDCICHLCLHGRVFFRNGRHGRLLVLPMHAGAVSRTTLNRGAYTDAVNQEELVYRHGRRVP